MDKLTVEQEERALMSARLTETLRSEALRNFDWDVAVRVEQLTNSVDVIFPGPLEGERIRDAAILEGFIIASARYALAKQRREFA